MHLFVHETKELCFTFFSPLSYHEIHIELRKIKDGRGS